ACASTLFERTKMKTKKTMLLLSGLQGATRSRGNGLSGIAILCCCLVFVFATLARPQGTAQSSPQQTAGLDTRNAQGLTPLIVAAAAVQNDHIDVVQVLIRAGANLNAATRGTGTALAVAELKGETQIAALLLAS